MKISIPNRIQTINFLICISFLCISFRHEITSICLYLVGFLSLIEIIEKKINVLKTKNIVVFFFISYFLVQIIGLINTENFYFGMKDIESKILFIVGSLIITANSNHNFNIIKFFKYYILGITINLAFLIFKGFIIYFDTQLFPSYVNFSILMHPTYLSIILSIAIIIIFEYKKKIIRYNFLLYLTLLFLSIGIILTDSKAGILTFVLITLFYLLKYILKLQLIKKLILIFLSITIGLILMSQLSKSRITELFSDLQTTTQFNNYTGVYNSSESRIIIWRCTKQVIKENLFLGTGTGDIKDVLKLHYQKKNYRDGINMNYNTHNQFLQILATFGIILGALLIIFLSKILFNVFKKKSYFFFLINLIFILNFLFESFLEIKAGLELFILMYITLSFELFSLENENY